MLVHEFLPLFVGQDVVDDILHNGRRFYRPGLGYIPVEFQGAAYRFGHSLVRPSYRANLAGDAGGQPFFAMIFDPTAEDQADPVDLRGGARAPRRFVGWQTFFDFGLREADGVAPAGGRSAPARSAGRARRGVAARAALAPSGAGADRRERGRARRQIAAWTGRASCQRSVRSRRPASSNCRTCRRRT
jgi:hypothetical protein